MSAVILINVERGSSTIVSQKVIDIDGIVTVLSVAGRYDLVAIASVENIEALSSISNDDLDKINEIRSVETLVSMKVFSQKALEESFSVGL